MKKQLHFCGFQYFHCAIFNLYVDAVHIINILLSKLINIWNKVCIVMLLWNTCEGSLPHMWRHFVTNVTRLCHVYDACSL